MRVCMHSLCHHLRGILVLPQPQSSVDPSQSQSAPAQTLSEIRTIHRCAHHWLKPKSQQVHTIMDSMTTLCRRHALSLKLAVVENNSYSKGLETTMISKLKTEKYTLWPVLMRETEISFLVFHFYHPPFLENKGSDTAKGFAGFQIPLRTRDFFLLGGELLKPYFFFFFNHLVPWVFGSSCFSLYWHKLPPLLFSSVISAKESVVLPRTKLPETSCLQPCTPQYGCWMFSFASPLMASPPE